MTPEFFGDEGGNTRPEEPCKSAVLRKHSSGRATGASYPSLGVPRWRETPAHIFVAADRVAHRAGRIPTQCVSSLGSHERSNDDKNLMQEEVRVSEYDGGFDADQRDGIVGSWDVDTVDRMRKAEDSQQRTFRHAFFEAVLRGNTDQYWAKRGHTPIEAIGEVYEKELAEVGK